MALFLQLDPFCRPLTSERQQDVGHLLAIARLLEVEDLAAAAIGDAGLRDLRGIDGVVALDVLGPHDTGDDQFADFEVDADLLLALDHEIAVRQHLRHHGSDVGLQSLLALDRALAVILRGRVCTKDGTVQGLRCVSAEELFADEIGKVGVYLAGAVALGLVGEIRLVSVMLTVTVRRSPT